MVSYQSAQEQLRQQQAARLEAQVHQLRQQHAARLGARVLAVWRHNARMLKMVAKFKRAFDTRPAQIFAAWRCVTIVV